MEAMMPPFDEASWTQASQCEGKQRFDRPDLAHKAAKRKNGRSAYRCNYCGGWHVGSERPRAHKRLHRPKVNDV